MLQHQGETCTRRGSTRFDQLLAENDTLASELARVQARCTRLSSAMSRPLGPNRMINQLPGEIHMSSS